MHGSVYGFLSTHATAESVAGKSVLEVGSLDVNGSPRRIIEPLEPSSYIGVDVRSGPKVDLVCDASDLVSVFGSERFDLVVSTEMLEHAKDWRLAVTSMKLVLAPGGLLLITTRSPGFPRHDHPGDYWRFTCQDAREIFSDLEELEIVDDPMAPGVFIRGRKPSGAFVEVDLNGKHVAAI